MFSFEMNAQCCMIYQILFKFEADAYDLKKRLHFISIVTLDVLLIISNFSTTCQVTLIRVLVYYYRLSVSRLLGYG